MSLSELSDQDRVWYILKGYEIRETNFCRVWFLNGKRHREDGPAIEYRDGTKEWYLNNRYITEEEFNSRKDELPV